MEHEFSLKAELDPAWAVRPLALTQEQGRSFLLLDDPGGEPLDLLLQEPMELGQLLRFAIGLSAALVQLHARGLIHKDIKPANVFVNPATGQVWLTGFGIASRLPRERQAPEPPEFIAGTLAYMAPEQTGRMNRSIDSRSDLYALGVTLYEMLTGLAAVHGFRSDGVGALPHRQAAGAARASGCENVPARGLGNHHEAARQDGRGALPDRGRRRSAICGAAWLQWEARAPHRRLPARRTRHARPAADSREALRARRARSRRCSPPSTGWSTGGTPELVLVSGYSGIGKSSVVNELHKVLVPPRGLFASGKFDQYKRDIPYATLAQAFQSLDPAASGQERRRAGGLARRAARRRWARTGSSWSTSSRS